MTVTISGTTGIQNVLGSASAPAESNTTTPTTGVYYPSATTWGVSTAGTNALYIDASQNVGIGTTPTSGSQLSTIQTTYGIFGGSSQININTNAYYNGGWKYIGTGYATLYSQNLTGASGTHTWSYSASGTAGNAITFNEAMRIDSSGNVGIGTTSPGAKLDVNGVIGFAGNTRQGISKIYTASTGDMYGMEQVSPAQAGTYPALRLFTANAAGAVMAFGKYTDSTTFTEWVRIDSSGNLLVGTTSATGHFTLKQSSNNYGGSFALVRQDTTDNWQFRVDGSSTLLFGYNSSDRGSFNSGTGAYTALSDRNKKKDFEDSTIGLSAVMQLKPTLYRMIDEEETSDKHLGFIAQEVKEVIPPAYVELGDENNKFIGLDYQPIVSALVKAIQELKAEFDAYKAAHP